MSEMDGFDYTESVFNDGVELGNIFNSFNSDHDLISSKINEWVRQMPRW